MTASVTQHLQSLTGIRRPVQRWVVTFTNYRGEAGVIDTYRTQADAEDYAREIRGAGGTASVTRGAVK